MDHLLIWHVVSMAWTEIGLGQDDYPKIAAELKLSYANWNEIDEVIKGDVLGSFALDSLWFILAMISVVGIFFITPMPDWGYEEADLRNRMIKWKKIPRKKRYLNPLRIMGYPIAWLISIGVRRKLKAAFLQR